MARTSTSEVSQLLQVSNDGDESALEKFTPLVYKELHRMARHCGAREAAGHTLQTTALVNEAICVWWVARTTIFKIEFIFWPHAPRP